MKLKVALTLLIIAAIQNTFAQTWGTQGKYLTKNGKPIYLSGVNYIVSNGWMINLPNLSKADIDGDMAAMQNLGINHIRFFPMWQLVQPEINKFDEKTLGKLSLMTKSAKEHNISMQLAPITGFMSGAAFLPPWAVGDVFKDPKIVEGQKFLARSIAERYKNDPAVLGYDFGNELNVLVSVVAREEKIPYTPEDISNWMKSIYPSFKNVSPNQLTTNGIGTGYDKLFDIRNIAPTVDYFSPHSYAMFHGTSNIDPWYGQRTTYSANFITSWCEMMGKPVVVQEIGCSEAWLPPSKIGAYLRLNYLSTWADGAAGFLWWASHDIDTAYRVKSKDMILPLSASTFKEGKFHPLEYSLGLLTTGNKPKSYASSFTESVTTVNKLGLDWKDELPVCYIIVPGNTSFDQLMHKYITAYALAKQTHFDVKLCYEGTPIPADASAVIVPGNKLNAQAKDVIQQYLVKGGKVYQSYENDFGTAITTGKDTTIRNPMLVVNESVGLMEATQRINIPTSVTFKQTTFSAPAKIHLWNTKYEWRQLKEGTFFSQPVGKGTYYYFSGNIETAFTTAYNPWPDTNFELLYSVLKPASPIEIDNKFVELYVKGNGKQKMVMLLNHSDKYQNVTVKSGSSLSLKNFETKKSIGNGREVTLVLKPAEVLIANY